MCSIATIIHFLSLKVAAVTCTLAHALRCQAQLPRAEQTINMFGRRVYVMSLGRTMARL